MILVIDNYDSFTFNLVQYLGELGEELFVRRNDKVSLTEVQGLKPKGIVISPGPGRPENAGLSVEIIRGASKTIPTLGVCLGHQAIAYAFGGKIVQAPRLMHGKTSKIHYAGDGIFAGLTNPFEATRYHSLMVERQALPSELEITAESDDNVIMGLQHRAYPIYGVQFHPESILTKTGKHLLRNFLDMVKTEQGKA